MHQTINFCQFRDAFYKANRLDNFTYEGLWWLFEYLEQYEDDTGEPIELDVIALCCDYTQSEYDEVINDYGIDVSSAADEEEKRELVIEFLLDNTVVIGNDEETVLFQCF